MPKQIRELSWVPKSEIPAMPHGEFLGELEWIGKNITNPDYSNNQVDRMRTYRRDLEQDYSRRKKNNWDGRS